MANIEASVEDWRDILPDEFKKLDEQNRKFAEAYERAIQEKNEIERKYQEDLKIYKEDRKKREAAIRALRGELGRTHGKYKAEIARIKSEYAPISGYGTTTPSVSGSSLSDLMFPATEAARKFIHQFSLSGLDDRWAVIGEEPKGKPKGKSKDNSTLIKAKDNSEEKEQVSNKDDGSTHVFLPDEEERKPRRRKKRKRKEKNEE